MLFTQVNVFTYIYPTLRSQQTTLTTTLTTIFSKPHPKENHKKKHSKKRKPTGILADEMGLGKTIQTIAYIAFLQEHKGNKGPHIVLAPKAVLHNWVREFAQWTPDTFRVVLYDGSPDERRALQKTYLDRNNFHVLVTNYELVMRDKAALRKVCGG